MAGILKNEAFAPELTKLVSAPPIGDGWLHEVKWDGYRIVATIVRGKVRLWSRNAVEWTAKIPELAAAVASLKLDSAQLDGEMIVPAENSGSDFNALQGGSPPKTRRRSSTSCSMCRISKVSRCAISRSLSARKSSRHCSRRAATRLSSIPSTRSDMGRSCSQKPQRPVGKVSLANESTVAIATACAMVTGESEGSAI